MQTRIREFRKKNGLTLQELAERIGTTPQTVQRLETANMTVSTDWLERFACIFDVHPADLIAREGNSGINLLGTVSSDGFIPTDPPDSKPFNLRPPGKAPVAVRLTSTAGPYAKDTILIADKLDPVDLCKCNERDCLVYTTNSDLLIGRILMAENNTVTLIPFDQQMATHYNLSLAWIAPIVMWVKYIEQTQDL